MGPVIDITGGNEPALPRFVPDCAERDIPGLGSTWVHGYTGRDVADWRYLATRMAKAHGDARERKVPGEPPTPECLRVAQALTVCRRGPGSAERTFVVAYGAEWQAYETMMVSLPGVWVDDVCREADLLTLQAYHAPPTQGDKGKRQLEAKQALVELLEDPQFWGAVNHLSLRLYGVSIAENGEPLGEVLTVMAHDVAARDGLVAALGALSGAVG